MSKARFLLSRSAFSLSSTLLLAYVVGSRSARTRFYTAEKKVLAQGNNLPLVQDCLKTLNERHSDPSGDHSMNVGG